MWVRPRVYLEWGSWKSASLGYTLACHANIRLGWKSLPGTNTLAYYKIVNCGQEKFYNIGPRSKRNKNLNSRRKKVFFYLQFNFTRLQTSAGLLHYTLTRAVMWNVYCCNFQPIVSKLACLSWLDTSYVFQKRCHKWLT